jgi:hypothetical protein
MVFGSLVFNNQSGESCKLTRIEITGVQTLYISHFTVKMQFQHDLPDPTECKYIFPTDSKICIFNTHLILDGKRIDMQLKPKEEAEQIFKEATEQNYTAVIGRSLQNGLSEFIVGNLIPGSICEVVLSCAFISQTKNEKTLFIKFPLEVSTPKKIETSLNSCLNGEFFFNMKCIEIQPILTISSNCPGETNEKTFSISQIPSESSIILTTEYESQIENSAIFSENFIASSIFPHLIEQKNPNSDFIFLLDCSGSMSGNRIQKAKECLNFW